HDHEALHQRAPIEHARLVPAAVGREGRLRQRPAGPVPARRLHRLAQALGLAEHVAQRQPLALGVAVRFAVGSAIAIAIAEAVSVPLAAGTQPAGRVMLAMNNPESPFLESVERRRPGTSLRGYVTRTLPHSSAIVVANRAPHEPRP